MNSLNIKVSQDFRKMTTKSMLSIILFIIVYFILIILSIGLTILCTYGGIAMIMVKVSFITLALGLGLISLGFIVLFFLFKFLFKSHKVDISHLIEIKKIDEPKLFQFIHEIVDEVGTHFPKKIFLSSDVNASVFYDSSFWSMFFPIRKNLQIGMGLVNTVSESEFKAILAHEFGHFSQKSMKVGSYVYNVNKVIYNMLYDNEDFDIIVQKWASASSYFAIFMFIALRIIKGIQWILKKMYEIVNVNYMALSREMEFHADEVAANVIGSKPLQDSLLRMELADYAYNDVISYFDGKIEQNIKSENLYNQQSFVMNFIAKENDINFENNLPLVTENSLNKYQKSKLIIKDQWASHPSTSDRIKALEKLNIVKKINLNKPASELFQNPQKIKKTITNKLFNSVTFTNEPTPIIDQEFENEYISNFKKNRFNEIYNGYYDNKNPIEIINGTSIINKGQNIESFFTEDIIDKIYEYNSLTNDKKIIENIGNGIYEIKSFEYDGIKYNKNDTQNLQKIITQNLEELKSIIEENDKKIYSFFNEKAIKQNVNEIFIEKNKNFFEYDKKFDVQYQLLNDTYQATSFMNETTPFDLIEKMIIELSEFEKDIKFELQELINSPILEKEITLEMKKDIEKYLEKNWIYFEYKEYTENISILFTALNIFNFLISRKYFLIKSDLLTFQAELLK